MPCKNCNDRWRIILANQENNNIMKKDAVKENNSVEEIVPQGKPDINKIIEDRRKALESGKTIKK